MERFVYVLAGAVALAGFTSSQAETKRELGAHFHGTAALNVVLDGDQVRAELVMPAMDMVGFEYAPRTDDEKAAAKAALAKLSRDALAILGLPKAANCTVDDTDVETVMLSGEEEHDEHGHHDEHDEKHGEAKHAEAEHGHDEHGHHDEHGDEETHSEVRASYRLTCAAPGAIDHLDVDYFAIFERAEKLNVQAVGPWGQTSGTLTADASRLSF